MSTGRTHDDTWDIASSVGATAFANKLLTAKRA
jgi:hypothetical protein